MSTTALSLTGPFLTSCLESCHWLKLIIADSVGGPFTSIPVQLWTYPRTYHQEAFGLLKIWHWNRILSTYALRVPIPQPVQELQATLYFLPVYLTNVSPHFLSKENFMVHHLTPNLNNLNSPPHAPFLHAACQNQLPFVDLPSNKGLISLG